LDKVHSGYYGSFFQLNPEFATFCQRAWFRYFKLPLDSLEDDRRIIFEFLRAHYFQCKWFEVYDFVEFVADNYPFSDKKSFVTACNIALQTEMSAYRLVDGKITQITAEEEIAEIEEAIHGGVSPVRTHLGEHLNFFLTLPSECVSLNPPVFEDI
jgi:hypothetical protein